MLNLLTAAAASAFFALWIFLFLMMVFPFNILISIAVFFGAIAWSYLNIVKTWIELGDDGITIRKGVITEERSTYLYSQIQDIKEAQSLPEMILGIKGIRIVTMTQMSAFAAQLPAFSVADAEEIKSAIFGKIKEADEAGKAKAGKKPADTQSQQEPEAKTNPFPLSLVGALIWPAIITAVSFPFVLLVLVIGGAQAVAGISSLLGYIPFILLASLAAVVRVATIKYSISSDRFEISYGLLSMQKASFDISKIQDIVIVRGLLERMLGLSFAKAETGSVDYLAASGDSKNLLAVDTGLPFMRRDDALRLREMLFSCNELRQGQSSEPLSRRIPLDPSKPAKKTAATAITLAIIIAITIALVWAVSKEFPTILALLAGAIVLGVILVKYLVEALYYKSYYYNESEDILYIRKGVITITEIAMPFHRIENIFVDQDMFDMVFGLYDLHISTVTPTSGMQSHIDGLNRENAEKLRGQLLKRVKSASG